MEIRATVPPSPTPTGTAAPQARLPGRTAPVEPSPPQSKGTSASGEPPIVRTRTELSVDERIDRVVGRVIDEETGEEIREIPPKELRRLYAAMREMTEPVVDETA